jgi:hypothetical protein
MRTRDKKYPTFFLTILHDYLFFGSLPLQVHQTLMQGINAPQGGDNMVG